MDRPLTRTACLADYPDCHSVAVWQQCHAIEAYHRWGGSDEVDPVLCLNWGAAHFRAPGWNPIYHAFTDQDVTIVDRFSAVFALSVLDRIDQPMRFLRRLAGQLSQSGLLVCTFAAWDAAGEDCAIGHELRHRIYDHDAWRDLVHDIKALGLCTFGGVDLRYRGDTLGDHTLATLVAVKRGC